MTSVPLKPKGIITLTNVNKINRTKIARLISREKNPFTEVTISPQGIVFKKVVFRLENLCELLELINQFVSSKKGYMSGQLVFGEYEDGVSKRVCVRYIGKTMYIVRTRQCYKDRSCLHRKGVKSLLFINSNEYIIELTNWANAEEEENKVLCVHEMEYIISTYMPRSLIPIIITYM
jgi:hypothetical protein